MRGSLADRVKNADYWYAGLVEEIEYAVTIFTRIDTKFMLEDYRIVIVQKMRCTRKIARGLVITHDDRTGWANSTIC